MLRKLYSFFFGTLRGRFIVSVALVIAVMMSLFIADLTRHQRELLLDRQTEGAMALADALATSSAVWIVANDISGLQELIDAQHRYPELIFAVLTDEGGQILACSDRSRRGQYILDLPAQPREAILARTPSLVDAAQPVMIADRHVGWARVGVGQKAAGAKLSEITKDGILYGIAAITIGALIALIMGNRITRRLYAVQQTINRVRGGDRLARASVMGSDEAAMIAHEFNSMLDAIAERDAELRASEQRYRRIVDTAHEGICVMGADLSTVFVNARMSQMIGYSPEEMIGKPLLSFTYPEDRAGIDERIEHRRQGLSETYEVRYRHKDGREIWTLASVTPIMDENKNYRGSFGMFTDITERKIAEQRANRLAAIVESSDDAIIGKDLNGFITSWNQGAQRIYGYYESEVLGKHVTMLAPPDRHDEINRIIERAIAGEHIEHYESVRRRRDGREIHVSLTVSTVRDDHGKIVAVSTIARDITERRRAEEAQRRLNRELQAITLCNQVLLRAENEESLLADVCNIVHRQAGYRMAWVGYANEDDNKTVRPVAWDGYEAGYLKYAGFTWADVEAGRGPTGTAVRTGQTTCIQDFATDPNAARWRDRALARGYRSSIALPLKDDSGKTFGVLNIYSAEPNSFTPDEMRLLEELAADLAFGITVLRVRLERHRFIEALEHAKNQADAANKAKDQFIAIMSHELRTPLTPVLAAITELESQPNLPDNVRADMQIIHRNVELETRLIEDLLDLTRIMRGKIELHFEAVDIHTSVLAALEIYRQQIQAKQLEITIDLKAASHHVWADPARLQQVFWNLIGNSAKFTPEKGSIRLSSRNLGDRIQIDVTDTGIGIDPDMLPRLFNPFEQAEQTKSRRYGGLGLGLTVARNILHMHNGHLKAASEGRNKGSTFTVELSVIPHAEIAPPPVKQTNGFAGRHVLLVEDNLDTLKILARLLRAWGYQVTTAKSVAEATEASQSQQFDLLISDIGLPDGSGLDIMRQLRHKYGSKGIAVSGYGTKEDIQESLEAGFDEHLTKPVSAKTLETAVRQVLAA